LHRGYTVRLTPSGDNESFMSQLEYSVEPGQVRTDRRQFNLLGLVVFGGASMMLFVLCMFWAALGSPWGPGASTIVAWLFFAAHVLLIRRRLSAMDPLIWIPVFMLLFYFGTPVAVDLMGFGTYEEFSGYVPRLRIGFALNLLALATFFFGVHMAGIADAKYPTTVFPKGSRTMVMPAIGVGIFGYMMVLIGIAVAGPSLLFGYYADLKLAEVYGNSSTSWFNVGILIVPAACAALLASNEPGTRWIPRLALVAMAPIVGLLVLIGDRGGLAAQMMALGWVFTQRYRKLPVYIAIAGFIFALILMPVLKEYRNYRDVEDASRLSTSQLVASTFYEMGSSGLVFAWAVDAVPRIRPYDFGASIGLDILSLVPWLNRISPRLLALSARYNANYWISKHIDPVSYEYKGANH